MSTSTTTTSARTAAPAAATPGPTRDYAATELDLQNGKLILDGQFTVALAFRSIYNVYNILAAYAAAGNAAWREPPLRTPSAATF